MDGLVDSKQQMISEEEIIRIAASRTLSEFTPLEVYGAISAEMKMPGALLLREGNTLFIIHSTRKEGIGFFRALNADIGRNFLDNSYVFIVAANKMGFRTLVSEFDDERLLQIFRLISKNPPLPGMGYKAERLSDGSFRVSVNLGARQGANNA